jgi:nucleotide-binding universal stress UspA family protein
MPNDVYDELVRVAKERAFEWCERAAAILKESGIKATQVVRVGQPADEITCYAKESGHDLIVMGAQGVSQLTRLLIGSTTEAVVHHAPCSVLVARNASDATKQRMTQPCVAISTDGSDAEDQIVTLVTSLALSKETRLKLLSVVEDLFLLSPDSENGAYIARKTTQALDRLAQKLSLSSCNIEKCVLEGTHVGHAISDFITSQSCDLVVVGDKGRSAIARFFLGSVSRFVLQHSPCSVLVAKKRA